MRLSNPLLSVVLATLLTASAGLPGWHPRGGIDPVPQLRLMAITELKAVQGGHFVTEADINGSPVTVLVDTGATMVALSYEDAEKVGLKPHALDFNVPVSTANGVGKAARVQLRQIMIDNVKVRDVDGLVLQQGVMRGTLLGMSFLSRLRSFAVEDGKLLLKN
ncbi:MAG: TIGR02281 family clan AA aspartic protease [Proteobacteria bacterium]|nr:TIGR02281 family clan AA aspartic protease [Pseudomonadota bacterium]